MKILLAMYKKIKFEKGLLINWNLIIKFPIQNIFANCFMNWFLPSFFYVGSLKALHRKFFGVKTCQEETTPKLDFSDKNWNYDENIVHAVWNVAQTCSLHDISGLAALLADFVSKVLFLAYYLPCTTVGTFIFNFFNNKVKMFLLIWL